MKKEERKASKNPMRSAVSASKPTLDMEKVVKPAWIRHARKGDFVLRLPKQNMPCIYANVNVKKFDVEVGHTGIITKEITSHTYIRDKDVTVEAWTEGGVQKNMRYVWDGPHYIMGIQRVRYVWRWRGFKSGIYRETTPVSNPEALAYWANQYVGRGYVRWYEFLTAKWAAPSRFTCTTLVWWSAKKAHGINVSNWYSTLVSPSGLFTSNETYVRAEVAR